MNDNAKKIKYGLALAVHYKLATEEEIVDLLTAKTQESVEQLGKLVITGYKYKSLEARAVVLLAKSLGDQAFGNLIENNEYIDVAIIAIKTVIDVDEMMKRD